MRIHRVLAREAGVTEERGERVGIDVRPGPDLDGGGKQSARRRHPREKGRGRRHDHARASGGRGMKRFRARGQHAKVRRKAAIRIDFVRREREDARSGGRLGQPFQRAEEEPDIAHRLFDIGVGRDHHDHRRSGGAWLGRGSLAVRGCREEQGPRRGREAGHPPLAGHTKPRTRDDALQEGLEGQGGGHV